MDVAEGMDEGLLVVVVARQVVAVSTIHGVIRQVTAMGRRGRCSEGEGRRITRAFVAEERSWCSEFFRRLER